MPFSLEHWKNPRKAIATKYEKNDICYATHGAQLAFEVLQMLDLPLSESRKKTILDYGCGTGRVSRILSYAFLQVYGYDPVYECIDLAKTECNPLQFPYVAYTCNLLDIKKADYCCSINVIEHLSEEHGRKMLAEIEKRVPVLLLWYAPSRNICVQKYLTEEQIAEDRRYAGQINVRKIEF